MNRSRIEAWIAEASSSLLPPSSSESAPSTPPQITTPPTKPPTKRKLPYDTPTVASPPLSDELLFTADANPIANPDPNLTPRAVASSKRRRLGLDRSIALRQPNFANDERPEPSPGSFGDGSFFTDDTRSGTGSTRTGVVAASKKSNRTRSPVKDMTDLRLTEKPVETIILESFDQLPPDVVDLYHSSKSVFDLRNIAPRSIKNRIIAGLAPTAPRPAEHSFYDMQSWAKEHGLREWDAMDKFRALKKIADRSKEATVLSLTEPAWNARVHEPLLDIALEPFCKELSHWDVTRASIDRPYLSKHQSGGDRRAKLVDFCITLSDPTLQQHAWDRLARASDNHSINHSSTNPLRPQPIAISIETKAPDGPTGEAKVQLSVWVTSHLKRLRTLSSTSATHIKVNTTLPVVQVIGSVWSLLFLRHGDDIVQLIETIAIGDTKSVVGCYQVVTFLRHLGHWALTVYKPWLYENVLTV